MDLVFLIPNKSLPTFLISRYKFIFSGDGIFSKLSGALFSKVVVILVVVVVFSSAKTGSPIINTLAKARIKTKEMVFSYIFKLYLLKNSKIY